MSFSEKYSVNLDIKNHLVHFPNHMMSMQVRQQTNKKFKTGLIDLYSSSRTIIPPHHQVLIEVHSDADITPKTGTVEGTPAFMRKTCLLVSPAVVDLDGGKTMIQVTNPNEQVYKFEANTNLANFRIPTPHQAANITPMPVEHLRLLTDHPDDAAAVINQLFVNPEMKSTKWYRHQRRAVSQTNSTRSKDAFSMRFWPSENWRNSILSAPMKNESSSCRTSSGTNHFFLRLNKLR